MKKTGDLILIGIIVVILVVCGILIFSQKTYIVKFELNNGTTMESAEVIKNEKLNKPENPTKEGYTFSGWYNGKDAYDFEKPVKEDMTLTALWAEVEKKAETVKLNKSSVSVKVGKTYEIAYTVTPTDTTDTATYSSSKKSVATVDDKGVVTAVKKGSATISVKVGDITKKLKVTVN